MGSTLRLLASLLIVLPVLAGATGRLLTNPPGGFKSSTAAWCARHLLVGYRDRPRVAASSFTYLEGEPVAWDLMTRIDNKDDYGRFIKEHSKTPSDPLALPKQP